MNFPPQTAFTIWEKEIIQIAVPNLSMMSFTFAYKIWSFLNVSQLPGSRNISLSHALGAFPLLPLFWSLVSLQIFGEASLGLGFTLVTWCGNCPSFLFSWRQEKLVSTLGPCPAPLCLLPSLLAPGMASPTWAEPPPWGLRARGAESPLLRKLAKPGPWDFHLWRVLETSDF